MKLLGKFVRAIWAGAVAFLGSLVTVMIGDVGFSDITDGQWVAAALVALTAAGGVYGLTNTKS
jgi:hypothetical protein